MRWRPGPLGEPARPPERPAEKGEAVVAVERLEARDDDAEDVPFASPGRDIGGRDVAEERRASRSEPLAEGVEPLDGGVVAPGARPRERRARELAGVEA